jgi:DNA-binding transcriptional LysR family regulator
MELRHLRYFVAIAEERSFTRAAERLWVAQPGLSTQIRRLESELGVTLLERHPRGIELTPAGTLFLERARAALDAAEAARATGHDLERGVVGTVRLGIATEARWQRTADVLTRFARERGGVELSVLEGYGGTLWRDLRDGRLDALISASDFASPDLHSAELGAEPWVVLVGKDHRLAGIGALDAVMLQDEQVVVTGHRDGAWYDRAVVETLQQQGVTAAFISVGPEAAMLRAVAHGEALALTTSPDALPAGVLARRLQPAHPLPFVLLRRDETPSPALSEFARVAAQCAAPGRVTPRELAAAA